MVPKAGSASAEARWRGWESRLGYIPPIFALTRPRVLGRTGPSPTTASGRITKRWSASSAWLASAARLHPSRTTCRCLRIA